MATNTVDVVVCKGRTVKHDGNKIPENTKFSLATTAADRLIKAGFVKLYSDVVAQLTAAAAAPGAPSVTVETSPAAPAAPAAS